MHLTRAKTSKRLPIPRKGTKYVARASNHARKGVSVVVAVRDILHLARTSKEVNEMVKEGLLKLNGVTVKDIKECIRLFNVFEADEKYKLSVLPTKRFVFEKTKDNFRIAKVVNKTSVRKGKTQLNLHDGCNILTKDKVKVGDSIQLDFENKAKKIIPFEKGKEGMVVSGKSAGLYGKIIDVLDGKAKINLKDIDKEVELDKSHFVVL